VNQSPFAVVWGVPVAAIGIAGYLLLGLLALLRINRLLLVAALGGMAFSLYLTHIEARILGVWCVYCVASLTVILLVSIFAIGLTVINARRPARDTSASSKAAHSRRNLLALLFALLAVAAVVVAFGFRLAEYGLSAHDQPSFVEKLAATAMRRWSIPVKAKKLKDPLPASAAMLEQGRNHWADHCASCHANNGSGETEMGKNMYPKPPDMRQVQTQSLSDGSLYYIIRNGVRGTGMPGWGNPELGDFDSESWMLVQFIRHLPRLTPEEEQAMEKLNPRSAVERDEEKQEEDFLSGETSNKAGVATGTKHRH
jgi:mono/diheme cytochrome c family protein